MVTKGKFERTEKDRMRLLRENFKLKKEKKETVEFLWYILKEYPLKSRDYLQIDIERRIKQLKPSPNGACAKCGDEPYADGKEILCKRCYENYGACANNHSQERKQDNKANGLKQFDPVHTPDTSVKDGACAKNHSQQESSQEVPRLHDPADTSVNDTYANNHSQQGNSNLCEKNSTNTPADTSVTNGDCAKCGNPKDKHYKGYGGKMHCRFIGNQQFESSVKDGACANDDIYCGKDCGRLHGEACFSKCANNHTSGGQRCSVRTGLKHSAEPPVDSKKGACANCKGTGRMPCLCPDNKEGCLVYHTMDCPKCSFNKGCTN